MYVLVISFLFSQEVAAVCCFLLLNVVVSMVENLFSKRAHK